MSCHFRERMPPIRLLLLAVLAWFYIAHAEFDSGFAMSTKGFAYLGKFCFVRPRCSSGEMLGCVMGRRSDLLISPPLLHTRILRVHLSHAYHLVIGCF